MKYFTRGWTSIFQYQIFQKSPKMKTRTILLWSSTPKCSILIRIVSKFAQESNWSLIEATFELLRGNIHSHYFSAHGQAFCENFNTKWFIFVEHTVEWDTYSLDCLKWPFFNSNNKVFFFFSLTVCSRVGSSQCFRLKKITSKRHKWLAQWKWLFSLM